MVVTLDPLIEHGRSALRCDDVPGLDGVLLTEFHRYWGGNFKSIEIRKATDVFGALDDRHHLLAGGRATGAVFKIKFTGTKAPSIRHRTAAQHGEIRSRRR